jgi:geranylgeranyl pyrophosphate synthase
MWRQYQMKDKGMTTSVSVEQTANNRKHEAMKRADDVSRGARATQRALALVKEQLDQVEDTLLHLPDIEPPALRKTVEVIVSSGGKRIRPIIILLIAALFERRERRVVDLASAVEMLHTATLVHDDLIDGSLMRRGASTLNAVWTPAATVLTGDYLFAVAAGLAARADSVRVMSVFADTLGVIVAGELRQQFTDWTKRSSREDYYARIYAKTASMFVLAAKATGVVCGASEEQITALGEYGRNFGLAFQIMDDILDFTAEQASVGKPVGNDLRHGLITLPTICYVESHSDDQDVACALRGECDRPTYDRLVARIRNSDAIACAEREADDLILRAKQALELFAESPSRDVLMDLADYTVGRDK